MDAPRDHAVREKDFGRSMHIEWKQPSTLSGLVALRHAEFQHHFSTRVKEDIRGRVTQKQLSIACEMRNTTLNEVLNGRRWIKFEDMLRIEQVVGAQLASVHWTPTPVTHPNLIDRYPVRLALGICSE